MTESPQARLALRFIEAFNEQRLDAFEEVLHPHVELQTQRGLRRGIAEARAWATKAPTGELDQRIVIERVLEHHNHVLVLGRKQWWWKDEKRLADDDQHAFLFTFVDGQIARYQPFAEPEEAFRAASLDLSGIEPRAR